MLGKCFFFSLWAICTSIQLTQSYGNVNSDLTRFEDRPICVVKVSLLQEMILILFDLWLHCIPAVSAVFSWCFYVLNFIIYFAIDEQLIWICTGSCDGFLGCWLRFRSMAYQSIQLLDSWESCDYSLCISLQVLLLLFGILVFFAFDGFFCLLSCAAFYEIFTSALRPTGFHSHWYWLL